jgi:outer membrane protein assembly factor BamD (BamD/ComL family)
MKKTVYLILGFLTVLAIFSCQSTQVVIPADATETELTKQAQIAFDSGNSKLAKEYYETIIERYGNNTESLVIAKYELAHLYIKEKNYKKAKPILEEILGLYEADFSNTLPPEYKKLAQIDFAKIPE